MPRDDVQTGPPSGGSPPAQSGRQFDTRDPGPRAQVREVKNQVVEQAKTSLRQARDSAASSLSESRNRAADSIGSIADAVRSTGAKLRSENRGSVANLTDSVADQVERLSSYLRNRDLATVREDLEQFARRQPEIAIGVALALGVLGARFIKSSQRSDGSGARRAGADLEVDTMAREYGSGAYGAGSYGGTVGRYDAASEASGGGYGGA